MLREFWGNDRGTKHEHMRPSDCGSVKAKGRHSKMKCRDSASRNPSRGTTLLKSSHRQHEWRRVAGELVSHTEAEDGGAVSSRSTGGTCDSWLSYSAELSVIHRCNRGVLYFQTFGNSEIIKSPLLKKKAGWWHWATIQWTNTQNSRMEMLCLKNYVSIKSI